MENNHKFDAPKTAEKILIELGATENKSVEDCNEDEKLIRIREPEFRTKLIERLEESGFEQKYMEFVEIFMDSADAQLKKAGCKLRIRAEYDYNEAEITYKGPKIKEGKLERRKELNKNIKTDEVCDYVEKIRNEGFINTYNLYKNRLQYSKDGVSISFDKLPIILESIDIEVKGEDTNKMLENFINEYLYDIDYEELEGKYGDRLAEMEIITGKKAPILVDFYEKETGNLMGAVLEYNKVPEVPAQSQMVINSYLAI